MTKVKKKGVAKRAFPCKESRGFELVVGSRMSPAAVAKARPNSLIAVDSAILCEQIQIVRCSETRTTSKVFKAVESVIYPSGRSAAAVENFRVQVLDSSNVVMCASDVKSFFGKIDTLPSVTFRRCVRCECVVKGGGL